MKKLNLITVFLIYLILFSCSTDTENELEKVILNNLESIKTEYYRDEIFSHSSITNFSNNKITNILRSNGSYVEFLYDKDLIVSVSDYHSDNSLFILDSYTHDDLGRLLTKNVRYNNSSEVNHKHEIVYDDINKTIQLVLTWADSGAIERNILLDETDRIKEEIFDKEAVSYTYVNNDIVEVVVKDDQRIISETKFNYLDKENSKSYFYEKYLFGNEWKNNTCLNRQAGYGYSHDTHMVSSHYVSDYKSIFHTSNGHIVKGKFEYEFDDNDRIIKKIEYIDYHTSGSKTKLISTYTYN